jgi:hypothetical protein
VGKNLLYTQLIYFGFYLSYDIGARLYILSKYYADRVFYNKIKDLPLENDNNTFRPISPENDLPLENDNNTFRPISPENDLTRTSS